MTAAELLAECQARNIVLQPNGGQLDLDAPAGALTDELLQRLRDAKPELLVMLQPQAGGLDLAAAADFCLLLTVDDLPPVPFRLNAWTEVRHAAKMLRWLRADIRRGPSGPRAFYGALQRDLQDLKRFVPQARD